jgi:hypothetical protein
MPAGDLESLKVPCPSCGHVNYPGRLTCENCGINLPKTLEVPVLPPATKERPGCVTFYAGLLIIGGVLGVLTGIFSRNELVFLGMTRGIILLVATLRMAIAYGLWKLKNWARILVIVFLLWNTTGMIRSSISRIAMSGPDVRFLIAYGIISLIFYTITIWWFASHKEYFN